MNVVPIGFPFLVAHQIITTKTATQFVAQPIRDNVENVSVPFLFRLNPELIGVNIHILKWAVRELLVARGDFENLLLVDNDIPGRRGREGAEGILDAD